VAAWAAHSSCRSDAISNENSWVSIPPTGLIIQLPKYFPRDAEITQSEIIRRLGGLDLLVIDEVGIQFGTDTERMILYEILDLRYDAMRPAGEPHDEHHRPEDPGGFPRGADYRPSLRGGIEGRLFRLGEPPAVPVPAIPKRLYSIAEAAVYLGRSVWAVREMLWAGKIPFVKVCGLAVRGEKEAAGG